MRVRGPQRVQGTGDRILVVGDHPDLAEVDANARQFAGQVVGVRLTRAAGEDLVPDDEDRGGGIHAPQPSRRP